MRLIDADRLKAVLENLKAHAEEHGIFPAFSVLVDYVIEVIGNQPTIVPPPNDPLTLEELRGMDGEPVWVEFPRCPEATGWMLVDATRGSVYTGILGKVSFENYSETWLAYRRRPEEE